MGRLENLVDKLVEAIREHTDALGELQDAIEELTAIVDNKGR